MLCSISGEVPREAVVSAKSGHLFEKSLISKYILQNGSCPVTGQPLSLDDLIEIRQSSNASTLNSGGGVPMPSAATSIPGVLKVLQNEWDALMLESFTLKQKYQEMRQELSHSLYQYDAACRVVARLMQERDSAREALLSLRSQLGDVEMSSSSAQPAINDNTNNMDTSESVTLSADLEPIFGEIEAVAQNLSKNRKKKNKTAQPLVSVEQLSSVLEQVDKKIPVHQYDNVVEGLRLAHCGADLVALNASDKSLTILNNGTVVATLKSHTKRVLDACFISAERLLSASSDKSIKCFHWQESNEKWTLEHTFKHHESEVTGLSAHPHSGLFLSVDGAGEWSFNQFEESSATIKSLLSCKNDSQAGFTDCLFHPDGLIFATADTDGVVKIWDLKSRTVAFPCPASHDGGVVSMAFSENGYYFATASSSTVYIWDLRKLVCAHEIKTSGVSRVQFDPSATYLAVGSSELKLDLYQCKTWSHCAQLECPEPIADFFFSTESALRFISALSTHGNIFTLGTSTQ